MVQPLTIADANKAILMIFPDNQFYDDSDDYGDGDDCDCDDCDCDDKLQTKIGLS